MTLLIPGPLLINARGMSKLLSRYRVMEQRWLTARTQSKLSSSHSNEEKLS